MAHFSGPEEKQYDGQSCTPRELFEAWGVQNAIAATFNEAKVDLGTPLTADGRVTPIFRDSDEGLEIIRHSTAHLMAQAVLRLYPDAKFGIGPAIKDGFYYDIQFSSPISDENLPAIEAEMAKIVSEKLPVTRQDLPKAEAIERFKNMGETFKVELISELEFPTVSLYTQGEFTDLCRGPHAPHTGVLKNFKLLSVAGAYWRGSEHNVMLTRIYGTAFATKDALKAHLNRLEEAKLRDHRKLGKELDLFSMQPEGPGFPFFHPKGMVVMNNLVDFWRREHTLRGYQEIKTPLMLDRSLWVRSGHWDHYHENMYFTEIDENPFAIKPMNCPGGILVYKTATRSYRELPLRLGELGTVHRHERSGVLHGLMRVRCFTQDDAHLYCTPDQIKEEIIGIMELTRYIYKDVFGFNYRVELSTRPENSMGDPAMWDLAEDRLREALEATNTPYKLNPGDGAFYGPKIDFHLEDCIGRTWQCGTIQLDFQLPEKFDMSYIGSDGAEHRPVMLHRTVLGSLERFMGILIEHYAGAFPYWLAPVQVRLIQVKQEFEAYVKEVEATLKSWGVRVETDAREEKLGKKIRDAQLEKIPYMLVIGGREVEERTLAVRDRAKGDLGSMNWENFKTLLEDQFRPR